MKMEMKSSRLKELTLREAIERIVGEYCDGTVFGLDGATFIEYFSDGTDGPQELANKIIEYVDAHYRWED